LTSPACIVEPAQQQQSSTQASHTPSTLSLGDEKWWEVFQDKELQNLIRTALLRNYDVRIAATRVLQAQSQLGITRPINCLSLCRRQHDQRACRLVWSPSLV
jgi:outer membrane protein TolC